MKYTHDLFNPTEDHRLLRQSVRAFVAKEVEPLALERDKTEYFDVKLFKRLGDMGLLGITVDEAYGGSGLDAVAAVIAHEELSYSDPGFCLAYLAHAMLCVNNLAVNGSESQKERYLPKLCSGEWIGAMGMSEPGCGTDVLAMTTTAVRDGDFYVINGRKMWITNGAIDDLGTLGDCLYLYARTGTGANNKPSISTFILEKGMPGYSVGQKIRDKTGMRASTTAELVFDHCKVPVANRVGEEGDSIKHMMRNLEIERLTLAAMSLGIAKRALVAMNQYASERMSFGKPLYQFGQIQRYIGDSYAQYQACRSYVYHTASSMVPNQGGNRLDSDGVKLVASTMAKQVADNAMQVLGGYGYVGEYVVERLWRDAKLLEIGGGTLEAHQKNITHDLARNPQWLL